MVNLNVGCLQDEGVIFVWVTGECVLPRLYKREQLPLC